MLVLPLLVTLGTAIGNSRLVKIKNSWLEGAALYGAVVANTGSMKTPALKLMTEPLRKAQTNNKHTWTSDTTVERLAELLSENPRGLLIYKDELTGLVRSMNQYKKGGADREFYLSCWSGDSFAIDRKQLAADQRRTSIHVSRPFISVVGCIPPLLLPTLTSGHSLEDGLLQRFLFTEAVSVPVRLSKADIDPAAMTIYRALVERLVELDGQAGEPTILELTDEAWEVYQSWHDNHAALSEGPTVSEQLRGFYNKHKGYCMRLALIHAVSSEPEAYQVNVESVIAAIAQTEYFKQQSAKVVARLSVGVGTVGEADSAIRKCQEEIKRTISKGGVRTKREVQRISNYGAPEFNAAWNALRSPTQIVTDEKGYFKLIEHAPSAIPDERGTDIPTTDTCELGPPNMVA